MNLLILCMDFYENQSWISWSSTYFRNSPWFPMIWDVFKQATIWEIHAGVLSLHLYLLHCFLSHHNWQGPLPMALSPLLIMQDTNTSAQLVLCSCTFDYKMEDWWDNYYYLLSGKLSSLILVWHEYLWITYEEYIIKKRTYLGLIVSYMHKNVCSRYSSQSCLAILKIWKDCIPWNS